MTKDYIQEIANGIKSKWHKEADDLKTEEHRQSVLKSKGKPFFDDAIKTLQSDINELNEALTGDTTSQTTTIAKANDAQTWTISRPHFPQVNSTLKYETEQISLSLPGKGSAHNEIYKFHVEKNNGLWLERVYGENPEKFRHPDEFAKHIMETLFEAEKEK